MPKWMAATVMSIAVVSACAWDRGAHEGNGQTVALGDAGAGGGAPEGDALPGSGGGSGTAGSTGWYGYGGCGGDTYPKATCDAGLSPGATIQVIDAVSCEPVTAQIFIDGQLVGTQSTLPASANAGCHTVEISATGYAPREVSIYLDGADTPPCYVGSNQQVTVTLEPLRDGLEPSGDLDSGSELDAGADSDPPACPDEGDLQCDAI